MNIIYSKTPFIARSNPIMPKRQEAKQFQEPQKENNAPSGMVDAKEFNTPSVPLLFQLTPAKNLEHLMATITDESQAIEFYTRLLSQAPAGWQRDYIQEALNEEKEHLAMFTKLYVFLAGKSPVVTFTPVEFSSYLDGIKKALNSELGAMDFYKRMVLSTTEEFVRQPYFFAMGDETEHAIRFSTILSAQ